MKNALKRLLTHHPLLTFVVMLVSAMAFGLVSFDLFMFLRGNLALVSQYGAQALAEGALEELLQLSLYGILSLLCYLLFKACEKLLVDWLLK